MDFILRVWDLFAGCTPVTMLPKTPEAAKAEVDKTNQSLNEPSWVKDPQSSQTSIVGESDCYVENQIPKENGLTADWFRTQMRRWATKDAIANMCLPGVDKNSPEAQHSESNVIGSTPEEYISLCLAGGEVGEKMYLRFERPQLRCSNAPADNHALRFNNR